MSAIQPKFQSKLDKLNARHEEALEAEREALAEKVKDSTEKNRQFFALYLGLLVYVLLMVFSTTDQMLLVPTQGIKLPLVDVPLPLLSFYWVAPLFLLAIHFNLLQNLESHHYKLMRWKTACGGAVPRRDIFAFLFDYEWLERGSSMQWLVQSSSRTLFLHSGPIALGILMWRFTDYQDILITSWHFLVFLFDSYLVWLTRSAFKKNEQPDQPLTDEASASGLTGKLRIVVYRPRGGLNSFAYFALDCAKIFWRHVFTLLVTMQFVLACWFHCSTESFLDIWKDESAISQFANKIKMNVPWLYSVLIPTISIDPNEIAWLPEKKDLETQAMLSGNDKVSEWWQAQGKGLNLSGRHLRFFSAPYAHLPKLVLDANSDLLEANLGNADLQGADLRKAQLQGASLYSAHLQGADLRKAQLQGASLYSAHLQRADLREAQLQGANLWGAQLQWADLFLAQLQGASLDSAQLQEATLGNAQLQGASLGCTQLQGASLSCTQLQGANLFSAQLQGTNLEGAQLQGAGLRNADLQGASLDSAQLQGTNLEGAQLQGANFNHADLQGAIVGGTNFSTAISGKVSVVFYLLRQPFSNDETSKVDWSSIYNLQQSIPVGPARDSFVQRIKDAEKRNPVKHTEQELQKLLHNDLNVLGKVIKEWDSPTEKTEIPKYLSAAKGMKRNVGWINERLKADGLPAIDFNINNAFCASQHFQELCDKSMQH